MDERKLRERGKVKAGGHREVEQEVKEEVLCAVHTALGTMQTIHCTLQTANCPLHTVIIFVLVLSLR